MKDNHPLLWTLLRSGGGVPNVICSVAEGMGGGVAEGVVEGMGGGVNHLSLASVDSL